MGSIDENALNALSLVVELTKHIKTKSEKDAGGEPETGAEFANFFPSFLWVIRDFTLQLVDENGNRISRTKQAKQLFKRYGAAYLTTSITLSLISYALCWSAVANGLDIVSLLRRLGLSAVVSPTAGVGTIAYVAHKAASPIRFPPTVALTAVVARRRARLQTPQVASARSA